jgi:hypothetical protein
MAPYGSAIKAWPSGQIMATPMIARRGGYPVRYAKLVASARLAAVAGDGPDQPDAMLQHAPFQPGCYDVHLGTEARGGQ